jgi:hypothetical protein
MSGEKTAPGPVTLQKVAKALNCDAAWLSLGDPALPTGPGPIRSRAPVVAALRASGAEAAIVAAIEAETHDIDPGEDYWWGRVVEKIVRPRFVVC